MQLRTYQQNAVEAVYAHLRTRDDNPCVVVPTGGGKTPIIAQICSDAVERWDGRVLVTTHVKELLEKTVADIQQVAPTLPVGIYSAGLRRRDLGYSTTVAGIQSIYQRADAVGRVDLLLVDEAHMIPKEGGDGEGMYRHFLAELRKANPQLRVVGFTATPYRLKGGMICAPASSGAVLNHVCYEIGVDELTEAGYLAPLRVESGPRRARRIRFNGLKVRAGEFVLSEVEGVMSEHGTVYACVDDLVERTQNRRSTLIFAAGVNHGERIVEAFSTRHGIECGFITGSTPDAIRAETLRRFNSGELRYLCNVAVLTTGYDAPGIDCIALMRPTYSPGLYNQMVGRGTRICPGKFDCLVIDYGDNALRHGLIGSIKLNRSEDDLPPARECSVCPTILPTETEECPVCGKALLPIQPKIARPTGPIDALVDRVDFEVHHRRDGDGWPTMRVEYHLVNARPNLVREWVCFSHPRGSPARRRAEHWWSLRSRSLIPANTEEAVVLANAGALARTKSVKFERPPGERFDRITSYDLDQRPPAIDARDIQTEVQDTFDGFPV